MINMSNNGYVTNWSNHIYKSLRPSSKAAAL